MSFKIDWIDREREPQNAPDPRYPHGIDLNMSKGERSCTTPLPYPAKRVGYYIVECNTCGLRTMVTTAGRPDDPRSLTMGCKETKH